MNRERSNLGELQDGESLYVAANDAEMAALDSLPPRLFKAVVHAARRWSAKQCRDLIDAGTDPDYLAGLIEIDTAKRDRKPWQD